MRNFKILLSFALMLVVLVCFAACSKSEEDGNKEHFASSQQRALEKAKGVEDMLQETEQKRRKEADEAAK